MTGKDPLDTLWSDPANWTSLGFYRCAADPRLMVLKRFGGIGYTINIAHQRAWFALGSLLAVTMAPVILNVALGRRAPDWLLLVTLLWPMAIVLIALVWLSSRDKSKS